MKRRVYITSLIAALLLLQFPVISAQEEINDQTTKRVNYSDPDTWLLGYFDLDALLLEPHNTWYNSGFDSYSFDDESFMELSEFPVDDLSITVVIGTWCPDSRRELPRFMKIIQSWGFPAENVKLIGVDSYKVAPVEDYDGFNIERVGTFIIYKNKVEVGRIVEYPLASLERDMVEILKKTEN